MAIRPGLDELFERRITYPDIEPQERLAALVGLNSHKTRLAKILGLLINPSTLETWVKKYHPDAADALKSVLRRPPLIVLAGDVGCGKSELAETIGDTVAREQKVSLTLYPMSLSTRGQGRVGEMTQLLSAAFDHTIEEATRYRDKGRESRNGVILLVDEADALAQTREAAQMHHEDRAGGKRLHTGRRPPWQWQAACCRHHVHQQAQRPRPRCATPRRRHSDLLPARRHAALHRIGAATQADGIFSAATPGYGQSHRSARRRLWVYVLGPHSTPAACGGAGRLSVQCNRSGSGTANRSGDDSNCAFPDTG